MKLKTVAIAAGIVCSMAFSTQVLAVGGASGPHVAYPSKGKIGEIVVNPYGIAPLTAVIRNGGYVITVTFPFVSCRRKTGRKSNTR